ncbi:MAG TPA: Arc family DNA-binding protein [Rhizomicrobium sp.]|jgi:plasmid stability protein|nr:Arc family DNA-binding protein [Rhizomicrobium sp.]
MSVNLSIRNVPDDVAERLRVRAKRNHRSLQGELMAIFEEAALEPRQSLQENVRTFQHDAPVRKISLGEAHDYARSLNIRTRDEAAEIIRRDRDENH